MTIQTRSSVARPLPLALLPGALVLAAVLLVVGSRLAAGPSRPNSLFDLPPFEMVRVETSGPYETVFHVRWESERNWKETVVWANVESLLRAGSYEQASDGRLIRVDTARDCPSCAGGRRHEFLASGGSLFLPGMWFQDRGALIRSRPRAEVSETEKEVTVRVPTPVDIEEWVFDKRTGIPISYRTMSLDGAVGRESRAVSVVLLSGEVVR